MNYKHIAIIALVLMLALVMPASAVWSNGNWVSGDESDKYFGGSDVKYDPVTGVLSKYRAPEDSNLMTTQGMVIGHLRSGGVLDGGARFLFHRVGTDANITLAQNFEPDGSYTGYLAPGEYDVILPQGTGSACGIYTEDAGYVGNPHEERTTITVVAGQKAYFDFIGNSIPSYGKGRPLDASINAYLGNHDMHLDWVKLVKTGEHQYTPPCYYVTVVDVPAYDETIVDVPAHTEYRYPAMEENEILEERTVGSGPGHHHEVKCTNPSHPSGWHDKQHECDHGEHQNGMTAWSDTRASPGHRDGEETRTVAAVTHTIHHPAVTHQQQVCPGPVTIPEFGFEYQIDITGAHVATTNPNNEPVNIQFSFDLNYFVDLRPWDNVVDDGRVVPRTMTYNGQINDVGSGTTTYHGFLVPSIGNAVTVFDWQNGLQYAPTISNSQVTSTEWTRN